MAGLGLLILPTITNKLNSFQFLREKNTPTIKMGRAPCCDKDKVKKGPWSPEEDAKLKAYIDTYGTGNNWIALPQKIGLMRCGKSCRLRWLNYLRPNIKHGGFSEEEDNIICSLYISIGSRWSIIAAQLPGRTDNDIKNYWNTRLKKKLLGRRKTSHINRLSASGQDPKDSDGVDNNNSLSNSALERLQLHMQLQNPFSLFNNPALWPNLNPLQEKMIQTLQSFNHNSNLLMQHPGQGQGQGQNVEFNEPKMDDELENSLPIAFNSGSTNIIIPDSTNVPKSESDAQILMNSGTRPISTFQAQLDNNKLTGFDEFDCFKEMEGSKDNMIWWSNEFDSTSWDSANCVLHQPDHVVYQDFELGYDMHGVLT